MAVLDLQAFGDACFKFSDDVGIGDQAVFIGRAILSYARFQRRKRRPDKAEALGKERRPAVDSRQFILSPRRSLADMILLWSSAQSVCG